MAVMFYILVIILIVLAYCLGAHKCFHFQSVCLSKKDEKALEVELFGENDNLEIKESVFDILNSLSVNNLKELKRYYERQEEFFNDEFRDFMTKANIFFQMYLWGWGYVGALVLFLLTGNTDKPFHLVTNINVDILFSVLVSINFIFFIQVIKTILFMPAYKKDSKNSVIKNISLSEKDFIRRCVQNKAYTYNCNSTILSNLKRCLLWTPIKFVVVMTLFTILAIVVVYGR